MMEFLVPYFVALVTVTLSESNKFAEHFNTLKWYRSLATPDPFVLTNKICLNQNGIKFADYVNTF